MPTVTALVSTYLPWRTLSSRCSWYLPNRFCPAQQRVHVRWQPPADAVFSRCNVSPWFNVLSVGPSLVSLSLFTSVQDLLVHSTRPRQLTIQLEKLLGNRIVNESVMVGGGSGWNTRPAMTKMMPSFTFRRRIESIGPCWFFLCGLGFTYSECPVFCILIG